MIKMQSTQNQDDIKDKGVFSLFKGSSGCGKTVAAISFPKPIVIDYDKKMPWIAKKHFPNRDIAFVQPERLKDVLELVDHWLAYGCEYETIIWDSVTTAAKLVIRELSDKAGEGVGVQLDQMKMSKSGELLSGININIYNHEVKYFMELVDKLKMLWVRDGNPKNVILIAHVITSESSPDLKSKLVTKTRSIVTAGKKVAAWLPMEFDNAWIFGYKEVGGILEDTEIKYHCKTRPYGEDDAKSAYRLAGEIDFTEPKVFYDELQAQIRGANFFA